MFVNAWYLHGVHFVMYNCPIDNTKQIWGLTMYKEIFSKIKRLSAIHSTEKYKLRCFIKFCGNQKEMFEFDGKGSSSSLNNQLHLVYDATFKLTDSLCSD